MKRLYVALGIPLWLPLFFIGWLAGAVCYFVGGGFLVAMQMDWRVKEWEKSNDSKGGSE